MAFLRSIGNNKEPDDETLIRGYKSSGELSYLGRLYERYMPLVYGVCLRYFEEEAAKDAVMQVFELLVEKLRQHEVRHFRSWLHVLTRNYCLMQLRSARGKGIQERADAADLVEKADFSHPEDGVSPEADLQAMERCMDTLPEEQRRSVDLFYLKEKSYKEIAALTGYEPKKVKSYIQNGRRNLKICIERQRHEQA
ncbi:sigma-70 family RNA polymerase sigma factor [Compostibacter hankyongensis]|uniref:Sigma-70 family RNA polymerase sigma factor n=1 Tax=Compostibacter hankyongensis TaxID=1007089 RepID=A0ABP8FSF9_9BACT